MRIPGQIQMKKLSIILTALPILSAVLPAKAQNKTSLTKYVNTFVGTSPLTDPKILGYTLPEGWRSWAGLTFPGSSMPNAMVQLSPMTEYGSGAINWQDDSQPWPSHYGGHCVSRQPPGPSDYGADFCMQSQAIEHRKPRHVY